MRQNIRLNSLGKNRPLLSLSLKDSLDMFGINIDNGLPFLIICNYLQEDKCSVQCNAKIL